MGWHKPPPSTVWRAIAAYLGAAYETAPAPAGAGPHPTPPAAPAGSGANAGSNAGSHAAPGANALPPVAPPGTPSAVRARLETLRSTPEADFYDCPVFEHAPDKPGQYKLRLGSRHYPHMKLVIDRTPDGRGFLLRADTHDAHCRPDPASREYRAFCDLMETNRRVAEAIEAAWEREELPTFKQYLREDLKRRQAAATRAKEQGEKRQG